MAMNIKNEEAHKLAIELAALTGESLTTAVLVALRERLDKLQGQKADSLSLRLMAIGKDIAGRLKEQERHIDHAQLLYDEDGLPK